MNARFAAVLVALLVVLGGGALMYFDQLRSQRPAASAQLGQPLLKGLQAAQIAAIAIREPGAALTVELKDGSWVIAERAGFAADFDRVRGLVLKAIELKVGQADPLGDKDRARLQLDDSGASVELRDAAGKTLARLVVGKKYFKTEPEQPNTARADGRFVLLPAQPDRVYLVSDELAQVTAKSSAWIRRSGIAAEKISSLQVQPAEGEGWKIERSDDKADWKLIGARADEKLEITKANAASYALANLELADIAPPDADPKSTGLARPMLVSATTFDGLSYTLSLGRTEGENLYLRVAIDGEPKPVGKDAEERLKKMQERLPRERALSAHTLLVAKSQLEDLLKPRAELLARKPERKKP